MRKITIDQLEKAGACAAQLQRIRDLVGSSVEVTEEWCVERASDFYWDWAARLLSDAAWDEYVEASEAAKAEYDRVRAAAWAEYDRVRRLARAECDRVHAAAWARAYIQDGAKQ